EEKKEGLQYERWLKSGVGKGIQKIVQEIDDYNNACKEIALAHHCHFIDITTSQRADSHLEDFIAEDKLHPSGKEYAKWAGRLFEGIVNLIESAV
ncbi:MAG: hypothetical protein WCH52_11285, partial [Bacteroidota bacterium]